MKKITLALVLMLVVACQSKPKETVAPAPPALPKTVEEAVASPYRTHENTNRDVYRHPIQTLKFFGLNPDMTVVEISPGTGWYLEILAPLLNENGKYIAALPESDNDHMAKMNSSISTWLQKYPSVAAKVTTSTFSPPAKLEIAPEASADMVLTFRNVHNWMKAGQSQAAFNAFFKALKPGGILGVVEHRANPKAKKDAQAKYGYVLEKDVIALAKNAGFKLEAASEVNANPRDTKDYPDGVWTLPPSLKLGDKDRDRYMSIGESDRMTLRFLKPMKIGKKKF